MASLAFLSRGRHAFAPVFKTGLRSFGSTSSLFRPSPDLNFPVFVRPFESEEDMEKKRQTKWAQLSSRTMTDIENKPILSPYSGRSVQVHGNLADSLKQLDGIIARNKVKLQLRMTERHEKKGYKRRRLASERWRNQFANEVRKKVQLVMKMRDRGA